MPRKEQTRDWKSWFLRWSIISYGTTIRPAQGKLSRGSLRMESPGRRQSRKLPPLSWSISMIFSMIIRRLTWKSTSRIWDVSNNWEILFWPLNMQKHILSRARRKLFKRGPLIYGEWILCPPRTRKRIVKKTTRLTCRGLKYRKELFAWIQSCNHFWKHTSKN